MFTSHEGEFLRQRINARLGLKHEIWVPPKDEVIGLRVPRRTDTHPPIRIRVTFSRGFGPKDVPPENLSVTAFTLKRCFDWGPLSKPNAAAAVARGKIDRNLDHSRYLENRTLLSSVSR